MFIQSRGTGLLVFGELEFSETRSGLGTRTGSLTLDSKFLLVEKYIAYGVRDNI